MPDLIEATAFKALAGRVLDLEIGAQRVIANETGYPATGSDYGPTTEVELLSRTFDPAKGYCDVEIRLTQPAPSTLHVFLGTGNGTGAYSGAIGVSDDVHFVQQTYAIRFLPGEMRKFARIVMGTRPFPIGATMTLGHGAAPSGWAKVSTAYPSATLTAETGAAEPAPLSAALPARPWSFGSAAPSWQMDTAAIAAMQLTDTHEANKWHTSPHGSRNQSGNDETGFYTYSTDPWISTAGGILSLKSGTLPSPRPDEARTYPHAASMVTSLQIPDSHFVYGAIEVDMMTTSMPGVGGAWPAFWLMQVQGGPTADLLRTQWPGEIDGYEGFPTDWHRPESGLSHHIHQGPPGARIYDLGSRMMTQQTTGVSTLASEYHKHAIEVTATTIFFYLDGIEQWRCVNPFVNGDKWFLLLNVAVKKLSSTTPWTPTTYGGGAQFAPGGEMKVRGMKMWRRTS